VAPEGSDEKKEARRLLFRLASRAAIVREEQPERWLADVKRSAPQLVEAVGDVELVRIAIVAWSNAAR